MSRRARTVCAALVLVVVPAGSSSGASSGSFLAPGPVGTVDTLVGPGFCTGPAGQDPAARQVGGVAVGADGVLWFQTGVPSEGLIVKASSTLSVEVRRTGLDFSRLPHGEGPAVRRNSSSRLAPDAAGGLLIAAPKEILQFNTGVVTIAGSSAAVPQQSAGDGQLLVNTRFSHIAAIASDPAGNVYLADQWDRRGGRIALRFLNRSQEPVTFYPSTVHEMTVAPGASGTIAGVHDRPVPRLVVGSPALAVADGRLYLAGSAGTAGAAVQMLNLGRRELSLHGVTVPAAGFATVATVAGGAMSGGRALSVLPNIAADEQGNLYLAEQANHRVRRVDAAGRMSTFAGTGSGGFNGNQRPANEAKLDRPYDVEVGARGRIFISDSRNSQLRVVDQAGIIHAALGNGMTRGWVCEVAGNRPALSAKREGALGEPFEAAADAAGNVYLALAGIGQVQRLAPSGSSRPVAGRPPGACLDSSGCAVADDVIPKQAALGGLLGVRPRPGGGLFLVEHVRVRFLNLSERQVDLHGVSVPAGALRTVVGTRSSTTPDRTAPPPNRYTAIATDNRGNLLLADVPQGPFFFGRGRVQEVDAQGAVRTLVEPPGLLESGEVDPSRCCSYVAGLATDSAGNLYIADEQGRRVWFLNRSSATVIVHAVSVPPGALVPIAGAISGGSQEEGVAATQAQLLDPLGITVDAAGNLYIVDYGDSSISRVDPAGLITTVVGTGSAGFNGDGLNGGLTSLNHPRGVSIDVCGNLLMADTGNDRVRRLNLVSSCVVTAGPAPSTTATRPLGVVGMGVLILVGAVSVVATRGRRWRPAGLHPECRSRPTSPPPS